MNNAVYKAMDARGATLQWFQNIHTSCSKTKIFLKNVVDDLTTYNTQFKMIKQSIDLLNAQHSSDYQEIWDEIKTTQSSFKEYFNNNDQPELSKHTNKITELEEKVSVMKHIIEEHEAKLATNHEVISQLREELKHVLGQHSALQQAVKNMELFHCSLLSRIDRSNNQGRFKALKDKYKKLLEGQCRCSKTSSRPPSTHIYGSNLPHTTINTEDLEYSETKSCLSENTRGVPVVLTTLPSREPLRPPGATFRP